MTSSTWETLQLRDLGFDLDVKGDETRARSAHRLHLFSLDLSRDGRERAGGVGISVPALPIEVGVTPLPAAAADDVPVDLADEILPALDRVRHHLGTDMRYSVRVRGRLLSHRGLGSTTQIRGLVCVAAAAAAGINLSPLDIAALGILDAGSCVGLTLMASPGVVIDLGFEVVDMAPRGDFLPHRGIPNMSRRPQGIALQLHCPPPWHVLVALAPEHGISGNDESAFWSEKLPTEHESATGAAYWTLMDFLPGLVSHDLQRVMRAIEAISLLPTKIDEVRIQGPQTRRVMQVLRDRHGFAGLSSLGPAVYTFLPRELTNEEVTELNERLPSGTEIMHFRLGGGEQGESWTVQDG